MRIILTIILLIVSTLTFAQVDAQDIDTSFIIKTPNSEINVMCKKTFYNGKITQLSLMLTTTIKINQSTIEEAVDSGLNTGKYYVNLHYNINCDLDSLSTLKTSNNSSFNNEVNIYFQEFVEAYNSNDLKKYFRESNTECGTEVLIFSYALGR